MDTGKMLEEILPKARIKARLIDIVSYASDAGFYHLQPKAVVQPVSEDEIIKLFHFSRQHRIPMTFRAAGTSLSGQSITDGILVDLSQYWNGIKVEDEGQVVRVQPGVTGAVVNSHLRKFGRKIGPDPASINSAMMGGILSNNASGMCCGVQRNSYHTTRFIRFILPNGLSYSTENQEDYPRFKAENPSIYHQLILLRDKIKDNPEVFTRIRNKYKTKNTVGYSVNAFIDHQEPLDILAHLLIGAEGTLGFISEAVMETVPDYPLKSTALLYFPDIFSACKAIVPLTLSGAEAVELMDRVSLRSVEHIHGVPDVLKILPETAAALLVEFQGNTEDELKIKSDRFMEVAPALSMLYEPVFTTNAIEQAFLWKIRKGMFPAVGAVRASGSTVILEDIAFPVDKLGDAILDLHALFRKHAYPNAIIFGHAKDGNIHFVVTQAFDTAEEIDRYDRFLKDVVELVVQKYDGALKAEHGTGRNMAPFVATEWGDDIYQVMKALKNVIDPENLLNPGVIINADEHAHIRNLKELPRVEEEVDKCMECGFCEYKCPSRNITLTPRRRIVVRRELLKLKREGKTQSYKKLLKEYDYDGMETCAVDGLCATACPVDINTGSLIKRLRRESHSDFANGVAMAVARNFRPVAGAVRLALGAGNLMNRVLGPKTMVNTTGAIKKVIPVMPLWSNQLHASSLGHDKGANIKSADTAAIYFPTCITRNMGGSADKDQSIVEVFKKVSAKAGVGFWIPDEIAGTCCGQLFSSKGYKDAYNYTVNETVEKLWKWTDQGKYPVVLDITSCTHTLQGCRPALSEENKQKFDTLSIIDSIDYISDYLLPRLTITNRKNSVVLHPVCSLQHMGLDAKFLSIARQMAENVDVPMHAGCCGMAGDRGFMFPELTRSASLPEAMEVKMKSYEGYYSTSKTCEMAMSDAVGKNYKSIIYLLNEVI